NGAGKTTTLEMLEGILTPTKGVIKFKGKELDRQYRERIGIQFQNTALQDYQTVIETMRMFAALYREQASLDALIEKCQLGEFLDRDTRKLSGGQRQRLLLAVALVNNPELVFLDEPTTGLDPQSRRNFWTLIEEIKADGTTIVLTTHYMEEAQQLCDDLAIVDHGSIIARGSPAALLDEHFPSHVLRVPREAGSLNEIGLNAKKQNMEWEIYTEDIPATLEILRQNNIALDQFRVSRPTLEDLFLKLTGQALRS
ncbi:MAG: ABC transporter ATP-binding protein, partial [bacterium]